MRVQRQYVAPLRRTLAAFPGADQSGLAPLLLSPLAHAHAHMRTITRLCSRAQTQKHTTLTCTQDSNKRAFAHSQPVLLASLLNCLEPWVIFIILGFILALDKGIWYALVFCLSANCFSSCVNCAQENTCRFWPSPISRPFWQALY